jgi:hypothetical protein
MQHLDFLIPRLTGKRFDDHTLPLEILKDFAALEEMIVEVAEWKFLQEHSDRKRVRNFSKDLELHLSGVEPGSSKPVFVLAFLGLFPSVNAKYFEQARTEIISAIAQAAQGQTPNLPPQFLSYFDRFGRGLREDERMEFDGGNNAIVALTPDVRKRLVKSSKVEVWTEELTLRGRICEMDQAKGSFHLELKDGTKLQAPTADQHLATVLEAFNDYRNGANVLLQGVVKKDRQDHMKSFESVEHISLLDPLDVTLRLEEIADLKDGWLDGKGIAPNPEKLRWLAKAFDNSFKADLPLPHLYPTPEGNIQAEWSLKDWEVTLEIDLTTHQAMYQAICMTEQAAGQLPHASTHEHTLALEEIEGWTQLNDAVIQVGGAQA